MFARVLERTRRVGLGPVLTYALGRFPQVRGSYGTAMGLLQRLGAVQGLSAHHDQSCFHGISAPAIVADLELQAGAFGLTLPPEILNALVAFCASARRKDWGSQRTVPLDAIREGRLPDGTPVFVADVVGADLNTAALQVTRDPVLLAAVTGYLGYAPVGAHTRILHSPVVDAPYEARRNVQTVDYHFDVHGYNFVYANFYLSDVELNAGAHEMVLGSHADKPAKWLFGSARRTDQEILDYYGPERIKTITGPAGTGFVQDSSCYHRVLAPVSQERLMLHIRYY